MTPQNKTENKKVTLYLIVEDTKETLKKIKGNAINLLNNRPIPNKELRSLPLFPSYRGSLVDAAEKVTYEKRKWLRLVLKSDLNDVKYPAYQFEKSSDAPFYLLAAYKSDFERATTTLNAQPPKYFMNGIEFGSILKVNYIDGENKRFSFLYKDKESGRSQLTQVFSLNEDGALFAKIVDWFIKENKEFETHYNKLLKRALERKPSEIIDTTNLDLVTVINPANVSVVCTQGEVWPKLVQVTKIDNKMLPVRSEYKYFLKQDIVNAKAFSFLETPLGRKQIGWKYAIEGATKQPPVFKKGKEKIKVNTYQSKTSLWRWLFNRSKKERTK